MSLFKARQDSWADTESWSALHYSVQLTGGVRIDSMGWPALTFDASITTGGLSASVLMPAWSPAPITLPELVLPHAEGTFTINWKLMVDLEVRSKNEAFGHGDYLLFTDFEAVLKLHAGGLQDIPDLVGDEPSNGSANASETGDHAPGSLLPSPLWYIMSGARYCILTDNGAVHQQLP